MDNDNNSIEPIFDVITLSNSSLDKKKYEEFVASYKKNLKKLCAVNVNKLNENYSSENNNETYKITQNLFSIISDTSYEGLITLNGYKHTNIYFLYKPIRDKNDLIKYDILAFALVKYNNQVDSYELELLCSTIDKSIVMNNKKLGVYLLDIIYDKYVVENESILIIHPATPKLVPYYVNWKCPSLPIELYLKKKTRDYLIYFKNITDDKLEYLINTIIIDIGNFSTLCEHLSLKKSKILEKGNKDVVKAFLKKKIDESNHHTEEVLSHLYHMLDSIEYFTSDEIKNMLKIWNTTMCNYNNNLIEDTSSENSSAIYTMEETWIDLFKLKVGKSYSIRLPINTTGKEETIFLGKLERVRILPFFIYLKTSSIRIDHYAYYFECPNKRTKRKFWFSKKNHYYLNQFLSLYFTYFNRLGVVTKYRRINIGVEEVIKEDNIINIEDIFFDGKPNEEEKQINLITITNYFQRLNIYENNNFIHVLYNIVFPILKFIVEKKFKIFKEENDPNKECNTSDMNRLLIKLSGEGNLKKEKIEKNDVTYNDVPTLHSNNGKKTLSYDKRIDRNMQYMLKGLLLLKYKPNETIQNSENVVDHVDRKSTESNDNPSKPNKEDGISDADLKNIERDSSSSKYGGKKSRKNKKSKSKKVKKSKSRKNKK